MDQYRPAYKAHHFPERNRGITSQEYTTAVKMAQDAGLDRLDERRGLYWIVR
jgi:uncharacterized Fe-S radical SAM superfamily protein PflX